MKKCVKYILIILLMVAVSIATFFVTMNSLTIETDGDGDSAFVSAFGQEWFYGINGYTIDEDGNTFDFVK